jgi:riboflavin kinase/FMN adenylyltransferase
LKSAVEIGLDLLHARGVLRFTGIDELARAKGPHHLALGVFDGVHLGHQAVISRAVEGRTRMGGTCGVLTFDPYPIRVLAPEKAPRRLLASLDHKTEILERMGVDFLLALPFDLERAAQDAEEFVREIAAADVKTVAVGEDWRFGKGRKGDVALLARLSSGLGFHLDAVPPVMMDGERISSTRIRQAIRDGSLDAAAKMLGRPYTVEGKVVEGRRLGRQIGFPTANVERGEEGGGRAFRRSRESGGEADRRRGIPDAGSAPFRLLGRPLRAGAGGGIRGASAPRNKIWIP